MGIFRKVTSMGTAGLVDFRSDKERTARYTKGSKKEAKKQTAIMQQQLRLQQRAANQPAPAQAPPQPVPFQPAPHPPASTTAAGWHPDPTLRHELRWFDGLRWSNAVSDQGRQTIEAPSPPP